jgi:D-glycero-D-manno-heptose 1,7-bisphosphate phosphatase
MKLKAVFLDKDGTLIPDIPYNINTDLISLNEGVVEGLQLLQSNGYLLVIVSNQSGIAHGFFTVGEFENVRDKMKAMFSKLGIYLDGFYYCPHHPDGKIGRFSAECECRKPQPGLLLRAAAEKNIDLSSSWMIGDILHDVEAGNRAGCKTILINNGNETEWLAGMHRLPEYFAKDLSEAARYIVAVNNHKKDEKKLERNSEFTLHKT